MEDTELGHKKFLYELRNATEKQSAYHLYSGKAYCAIGLLAKRAGMSNGQLMEGGSSKVDYLVRETYGLDSHEVGVVMNLNDNYRWTFGQIADYFEKKWSEE